MEMYTIFSRTLRVQQPGVFGNLSFLTLSPRFTTRWPCVSPCADAPPRLHRRTTQPRSLLPLLLHLLVLPLLPLRPPVALRRATQTVLQLRAAPVRRWLAACVLAGWPAGRGPP